VGRVQDRAALLVLGFLVAAPGAGADGAARAPLEPALARARAALVGRLEALASWTEDKRLGGFRHRVFRTILAIAPDHPRARGGLKYSRRSKKEPWVQAQDYVEPPDWGAGHLPEAERRRTEALERHRDDVLAALDAADAPRDRRTQEEERLIDLLPDDAVLRRPRGDVEQGGRWVLAETPRSIARREELLAWGRAAEELGRSRTRPDPEAAARNWDVGFRSPARAIFGQVELEELPALTAVVQDAEDAVTWMEGIDHLVRRLVGGPEDATYPRVLYFFPSRDRARRWLETHAKFRDRLDLLDRLTGLALPDGAYLTFGDPPGGISVLAARLVASGRLRRRFHDRSRGWIGEGLGQRLVWYGLRRHGASFVNVDQTDRGAGAEQGAAHAPATPEAWLSAASAVLDEGGPARLSALLTRQLNAMTTADVLLAYGLAAYLLEAQPTLLVPFLEANTSGDDAVAQVREVFDLGVAELAWRLRRWLRETG
jgi:hypothetical protein